MEDLGPVFSIKSRFRRSSKFHSSYDSLMPLKISDDEVAPEIVLSASARDPVSVDLPPQSEPINISPKSEKQDEENVDLVQPISEAEELQKVKLELESAKLTIEKQNDEIAQLKNKLEKIMELLHTKQQSDINKQIQATIPTTPKNRKRSSSAGFNKKKRDSITSQSPTKKPKSKSSKESFSQPSTPPPDPPLLSPKNQPVQASPSVTVTQPKKPKSALRKSSNGNNTDVSNSNARGSITFSDDHVPTTSPSPESVPRNISQENTPKSSQSHFIPRKHANRRKTIGPLSSTRFLSSIKSLSGNSGGLHLDAFLDSEDPPTSPIPEKHNNVKAVPFSWEIQSQIPDNINEILPKALFSIYYKCVNANDCDAKSDLKLSGYKLTEIISKYFPQHFPDESSKILFGHVLIGHSYIEQIKEKEKKKTELQGFKDSKKFLYRINEEMNPFLIHNKSPEWLNSKIKMKKKKKKAIVNFATPEPTAKTENTDHSDAEGPKKNIIFGSSLRDLMDFQKQYFSEHLYKIPVILKILISEIIKLDGFQTEGLFRISAQQERVIEIKDEINKMKKNYGVGIAKNCKDVHVFAGLFKMWIRELPEPVVPAEYYEACIQMAEEGMPGDCGWELIKSFDKKYETNQRVLYFIIYFLKQLVLEKNLAKTKMTGENISTIFGPILLNCKNTAVEQAEMMRLINLEKTFLVSLISSDMVL